MKASFKAKFHAGERIGAYAPIGYLKDPEVKNHLVVDPDTRWIVEKIFSLAVHGAGAARITKRLIQEQVPTPGWLNFARFGTFANIYKDQPPEKAYAWTIAQVKSILKDETYIGNTIHYRETNISFKNKRRVRKDPSEWLRVCATHEAIVSEDVFRRVQDMIAQRRRQQKDATTQIFSGLLKCADCGWSMGFGTNRQNKTPYSHYHCSQYGQMGKVRCSAHYIRYDILYPYVLSRLQYWFRQVEVDEGALLQRLLAAGDQSRAALRKKQVSDLKKAESRRAEVDGLFTRVYEDHVAGRISEYNFRMLSEKYQEEQARLAAQVTELQAALASGRKEEEDAGKWIALIRQMAYPTELTATLLNAVIEKILIHEAVKGQDGTREQEIEIFYRFVGKID